MIEPVVLTLKVLEELFANLEDIGPKEVTEETTSYQILEQPFESDTSSLLR